jgi:hypothetical protein
VAYSRKRYHVIAAWRELKFKTMQTFNFIPAIKWDSFFEGIVPIVFFGCEGFYLLKNGTYYIMYDGGHVATKTGSAISYNDKVTLPRGFKAAIKQFCK